ncbi:hypothetical protein ACGFY9_27025 [Streptomyces sp. NPDC048504]|uniref:hypothetical protein n=1 Tax=Streptomyces sp. NPDC048504 TaxID=3365559 RepID=UPI0037131564
MELADVWLWLPCFQGLVLLPADGLKEVWGFAVIVHVLNAQLRGERLKSLRAFPEAVHDLFIACLGRDGVVQHRHGAVGELLLSLALLLRGPGLAAGVDSVQEDTRSFQPLVSVGAVHGRSGAEMSGPQRVDGRDAAPTMGPRMVTSEVMSAMVRAGRVRLVPFEVVQRVPSGNGP